MNLHALRRCHLKAVRLPIPPPGLPLRGGIIAKSKRLSSGDRKSSRKSQIGGGESSLAAERSWVSFAEKRR